LNVPQLNGKQTEPRPDFNKLQPATAAPQQETQPAVSRAI
jgi:hypothetical protein